MINDIYWKPDLQDILGQMLVDQYVLWPGVDLNYFKVLIVQRFNYLLTAFRRSKHDCIYSITLSNNCP